MNTQSLDLSALRAAYAAGETPLTVLDRVCVRIAGGSVNPVWISLVPRDQVQARARAVQEKGPAAQPLYGVPFAVKDNMDVAGMETTAGCPAFAYRATATAAVVRRLEEAGAILVGKTNLDQFATGLVGVRSPYGACASVFDARYISGGSSSGSAVAVASGLVSFALGTDTAGSGRVPAAFNNLVGLKPTRGLLSAAGVVPACRSLDCVSVFALTCGDADQILDAARGFDPADPYSRADAAEDAAAPWGGGSFRFGVLRGDQREFFGDAEAAHLYQEAVEVMAALGGEAIPFDFVPFRETAALLYGPWVAERRAALGAFFDEHTDDIHPVVRGIVSGAGQYSAADGFRAQYRLEELRQACRAAWGDTDVLLLPTAGTTYTLDDVAADPVRLNTNLGYYTNFVNLLDLAAVALPAGLRSGGLPFGVTVLGPAGTDRALLTLADRLHRCRAAKLGGTDTPLDWTPLLAPSRTPPGCTLLAVVGAHLTGQPLNFQLTDRGARRVATTRTDPGYRLYALPGTTPPKPGLVRAPGLDGPGLEVEVWAMPTAHFGSFVAAVPPPLGIGRVALSDGEEVAGFVCEPYAIAGAAEITAHGGWRAFLGARLPAP